MLHIQAGIFQFKSEHLIAGTVLDLTVKTRPLLKFRANITGLTRFWLAPVGRRQVLLLKHLNLVEKAQGPASTSLLIWLKSQLPKQNSFVF